MERFLAAQALAQRAGKWAPIIRPETRALEDSEPDFDGIKIEQALIRNIMKAIRSNHKMLRQGISNNAPIAGLTEFAGFIQALFLRD